MTRAVVLLGTNGHLGKHICDNLSGREWSVIGIDRQRACSVPTVARYHSCDLRDLDSVEKIVSELPYANHTELVFISAVGTFGASRLGEAAFDTAVFLESLQVNLIGVCLFLIPALTRCLDAGVRGRAVVVGSTASAVGSLDVGYGVSKAGLNGLVRSLSKALAPKGAVIVGVNPGIFESSMSRGVSSDRQDRAVQASHIGRRGRVDEIVNCVAYLATEAPDYLTGSIVSVNGGQWS